ncbi:MAG: hypothetical protein WAW37_13235 [Syntrophobacteraceae bacterium]
MKKPFAILPGIWLLFVWCLLFPSPAMAKQDFRDRVQAFWDAQVVNDPKVLYQYLPIEERDRIGSEDFVTASRKKSPLHFLNFRLVECETASELGWAHVVYDASLAEFAEYPPRHIDLWQTWERQDGEWLPVSARRKDDVPRLPPRMRPAEEEQLLGKRVDEFWAAKEREDWGMVYSYCDPEFRNSVSSEEFLGKSALFTYLSHAIEWAEVTGEKARVKVVSLMRRNDPHLSKAAPVTESVVEDWVKDCGQWYRLVVKPE